MHSPDGKKRGVADAAKLGGPLVMQVVRQRKEDNLKVSTLFKLIAGIILPAAVLFFVVADRIGLWDRISGLDDVLEVAARLETSYAKGIDRQIGPDETAWETHLDLIEDYSLANLPDNKTPRVLARSRAVLSGKIDLPEGKTAEWTAPSTPIILIYDEWPGKTVPSENTRIVGTIADLRIWVDRRRSDRRFVVQDVFLSLIALCLSGVVMWYETSTTD